MPSSRIPTSITTGPGAPPPGGGQAEDVAASLVAHITDPTGAHEASAVSYAGGVNWADGTSNPASNVETQVDKILSDLSPVAAPSGARKIGAESVTVGTVTHPNETMMARLTGLQRASGIAWRTTNGPVWADGGTNVFTNVETQIDKMLTDLANKVAPSGAARLGVSATTVGTVTTPAATLYERVEDLQDSANISAAVYAGTSINLAAGSVLSQLHECADKLAGLGSNTFTGDQSWGGSDNNFQDGDLWFIHTTSDFNLWTTGVTGGVLTHVKAASGFWQFIEQTSGDNILQLNADGTVVIGDTGGSSGGLEIQGWYTAAGIPGVALHIPAGNILVSGNKDLIFSTGASEIKWPETTIEPLIWLPTITTTGATDGTGFRLRAQQGRPQTAGNPNNPGGHVKMEMGLRGTGGNTDAACGQHWMRFGDDSTYQWHWKHATSGMQTITATTDLIIGPTMADDDYHLLRIFMVSVDDDSGYTMRQWNGVVRRNVGPSISVLHGNEVDNDGGLTTTLSLTVNGTSGWKIRAGLGGIATTSNVIIWVHWMEANLA